MRQRPVRVELSAQVRSLFLEEGVANFLKQGASAPEPRVGVPGPWGSHAFACRIRRMAFRFAFSAELRLTVSKLLAHLSGNEVGVLDCGTV